MPRTPGGSLLRERLRRAFWLPPALAIVLAVPLAYALPAIDASVDVDVGLFTFNDLGSARSLLATIASATVSVAGLSFSVTLVALQLASSQLSPRVLTTFREDRVAQATLAAFLGVFAYTIILLGRLTAQDRQVPEISLIVAMLGVLAAFGLFVAFIGRVVAGLQASTVIRRIATDGDRARATRHPRGIGTGADEAEGKQLTRRWLTTGIRVELRARRGGFLLQLDGGRLLEAAQRHDALIVQRVQVGELMIRGQLVGEAFVLSTDRPHDVAAVELERGFRYGEERTLASDVGFPVRSLADVALRALSPSLNDPTTAENALGALTDTLAQFVVDGAVQRLRLDGEGAPRLLALVPDLDDLVRLGFEQVRLMVIDQQPVLAARLVLWLDELDRLAEERGLPRRELHRQRELLRPTADADKN